MENLCIIVLAEEKLCNSVGTQGTKVQMGLVNLYQVCFGFVGNDFLE